MGEYRLDLLGWFQFERLCQTLLTVPYGLAIEVWGGSRDLARDAYTEESLRFPKPDEDQEGPFLFQVKFVEDAAQLGDRAVTRLKAALREEASKITRLMERDDGWAQPRHYVVMTNCKVGAGKRAAVTKIIGDALPKTQVHLLHEPDLEVMINAAPGVRLSFPQILSLRDLKSLLEDVVTRDLANRADALLSDAQEFSAVFVPTRAYHQAVERLREHAFVVLTGPPEMGKTSIAKMIALAQAATPVDDTTGWEVVNCRGPGDFDRAFERGRAQVYVADDAFGSTEYRPQVAEEWAQALPDVLQRVDKRHWLIWTSRSEPLRTALECLHLQGRAEGFPEPAKVLVNAGALTVAEKAMMLYRHARAAGLSDAARGVVRANAERIVLHPHFTPLRIRRFVRNRLEELVTEGAQPDEIALAVEEELRESTDSMDKSFGALDQPSKDLLISLLDVPGELTIESIAVAYGRLHRGQEELEIEVVAQRLEEHFLRAL